MRTRTIGDHIDAARDRVDSSRAFSIVHERLKNLIFDGKRLADFELSDDREQSKRQNEMLALGHVLVGTNVDLDISSIVSLNTKELRSTPDFEAQLISDKRVRIEVVRIADRNEKQYLDALTDILRRTNEALNATDGIVDLIGPTGPFYFGIYARAPLKKEVIDISFELSKLVLVDGPSLSRSLSMRRVGEEYPILHSLETHWTREPSDANVTLKTSAFGHLIHRGNPLEAMAKKFAEKSAKFDDYSYGRVPVWLAFYVDTPMSYPLGTVTGIANSKDLDPAPFERLLIGCLTHGTVY